MYLCTVNEIGNLTSKQKYWLAALQINNLCLMPGQAFASLAANRAASELSGFVRSAGVKSFSNNPGVRSRDALNRSMSTTSIPIPSIIRAV
jgi:hypothetical protein